MEALAGRLSVALRKPLLRRYRIGSAEGPGGRIVLVQPLTFMNRSGEVADRLIAAHGSTGYLVVHDSMDLSPGHLRFRLKGSSGGHKGLASLIAALGTEDFPRLAVGVGRPSSRENVIDHVLSAPSGDDALRFRESIEAAAEAVLAYSRDGAAKVMNEFNRKEVPPSRGG